jgi:hypothetical protein
VRRTRKLNPDLSKESTLRLVEVLCNLLEELTHDVKQISEGLIELKSALAVSNVVAAAPSEAAER